MPVAAALDRGIPGCVLVAVSARDLESARRRIATFGKPVPVVPASELESIAELVVECAPSAQFQAIVHPFAAAGKTAFALSAGALLENFELVELARDNGGQIVVPTGALVGLDAVSAAAEGKIESVRLVTRKPPRSLAGAPYLAARGILVEEARAPQCVFRGSAREAALGFPANVNVAAALALAGVGPDRTEVEIWADPALSRNQHRIEVEADAARFTASIENVPSENPRTGRITPLSVIAALRKLRGPLRVGT